MLRNIRLGWNEPLNNILHGQDADQLRRIFSSLQNWLEFPVVGLQGTLTSIANNSSVLVPWSATELYDDYSLHSGTSTNINVPSQARTYLAVGAFAASYSANTTGRRVMSWLINGVATNFRQSAPGAAVGATYCVVPIIAMVKKTDQLQCTMFQDSGGSLGVDTQEAWVLFLPFGA